jgi:hypothetical protein
MATQQPTGLVASSDYKLSSLYLLTSTGHSIDLSGIMLELNLFEDIFSPAMTGDILVGDGGDILSSFQVHGNEFISMIIDKPSLGLPLKKVFRVYKISDRSFSANALQNYRIHFCSEELLLSTQLMISKSYKGLPITTMVKDILSNKLLVSDKKMGGIFSISSGNFDLIVPRMQPFRAIQWLAPKAYTNKGNLFFFFENRDGFNFASYEDLIAVPPYATYQRAMKLDNDPAKNVYGYNHFSIIQDFDTIKATRMGAYSATLLSLDIVNRSRAMTNINWNDSSDALLNKSIPINDFKNRFGATFIDTKDNMIKYIVGSDSDPTFNPALMEQWIPQTISRLGQINAFKAVMIIPGDVLVKAGMIVNVDVPKMQVQDTKSPVVDPMRSGSYLVSAVHHKFQLDIMTTIVELLSDSVNTPMIAAATNLPGLDQIKQA